jgi:hypothetical protein
MATALGPQIESLKTRIVPPLEPTDLEPVHPAESSADSCSQQGSSIDGLLIWICINCWLLLVGMHVYELLAWLVG